jgi:hypothetical protein
MENDAATKAASSHQENRGDGLDGEAVARPCQRGVLQQDPFPEPLRARSPKVRETPKPFFFHSWSMHDFEVYTATLQCTAKKTAIVCNAVGWAIGPAQECDN